DAADEDAALERSRVSRSAGTVRRRICRRDGRGSGEETSRRDQPQQAQQRAGRGDGEHEAKTNSQETSQAFEAGARIRVLARAARLDGARRSAGYSTGSAP